MRYRLFGRTGSVRLRIVPGDHDVRREGILGSRRPARRVGGRGDDRGVVGRRRELPRYGRRLFRRGIGKLGRRGTRLARASPRSTDRCHQGPLSHGPGAESGGPVAGTHLRRGRRQPAPLEARLHRPLPDPRGRPRYAYRGDGPCAGRSGALRQGAVRGLLQSAGLAGDEVPGLCRPAWSGPFRQRPDVLRA